MEVCHQDGHRINPDWLEKELADFYLYFHSLNERTFCDAEKHPRLLEYIDFYYEYEFSAKLINLAIQLRTYDDKLSLYSDEDGIKTDFSAEQFSCGTLKVTKRNNVQESDLNLREAFNKIIHADTVGNDVVCHSNNQTLQVKLENTKGAWEATIDLNQFVFSSIDFVLKADEILCDF